MKTQDISADPGVKLVGKKPLVPDAGYIRAFLLYETKRCRNCGRPLSSERSIAIGFGPTCASEFAARWIRSRPSYLGERAKKIWSAEEVASLVAHARKAKGGNGR